MAYSEMCRWTGYGLLPGFVLNSQNCWDTSNTLCKTGDLLPHTPNNPEFWAKTKWAEGVFEGAQLEGEGRFGDRRNEPKAN